MNKFGPYLLSKEVATVTDLSQLIIHVLQLPDVSSGFEGAMYHLVGHQVGYHINHIYTSKDDKWIDITEEFGPQISKEDHETFFDWYKHLNPTDEDGAQTLDGYIALEWSTPSIELESGTSLEFDHDVVVRKIKESDDDYPSNPNDGEILVYSSVANAYKTVPYLVNDLKIETEINDKYNYRVFHVFKSGWWCYTNGSEKSN